MAIILTKKLLDFLAHKTPYQTHKIHNFTIRAPNFHFIIQQQHTNNDINNKKSIKINKWLSF